MPSQSSASLMQGGVADSHVRATRSNTSCDRRCLEAAYGQRGMGVDGGQQAGTNLIPHTALQLNDPVHMLTRTLRTTGTNMEKSGPSSTAAVHTASMASRLMSSSGPSSACNHPATWVSNKQACLTTLTPAESLQREARDSGEQEPSRLLPHHMKNQEGGFSHQAANAKP